MLSKESLIQIGLSLTGNDLANYCSSSPIINRVVCSNPDFWITKLRQKYPAVPDFSIFGMNPRDLYNYLETKPDYSFYLTVFVTYNNLNFIREIQVNLPKYLTDSQVQLVIIRFVQNILGKIGAVPTEFTISRSYYPISGSYFTELETEHDEKVLKPELFNLDKIHGFEIFITSLAPFSGNVDMKDLLNQTISEVL